MHTCNYGQLRNNIFSLSPTWTWYTTGKFLYVHIIISDISDCVTENVNMCMCIYSNKDRKQFVCYPLVLRLHGDICLWNGVCACVREYACLCACMCAWVYVCVCIYSNKDLKQFVQYPLVLRSNITNTHHTLWWLHGDICSWNGACAHVREYACLCARVRGIH